jgi:cytoskeletal protein CcmA (bactofilin family)
MITISESLLVKENIYTQLSSVRGMITISESLLVKENIYTQLSSVRGMITISEQLLVKGEHIYTAVISERNDNNIRTTSCKRQTYIHTCH